MYKLSWYIAALALSVTITATVTLLSPVIKKAVLHVYTQDCFFMFKILYSNDYAFKLKRSTFPSQYSIRNYHFGSNAEVILCTRSVR